MKINESWKEKLHSILIFTSFSQAAGWIFEQRTEPLTEEELIAIVLN